LISHVDEYRKDRSKTGKNLTDTDHDLSLLMGADEVVDLHIESLTDDYTGMNNAEIVNLQLTAFRRAMDKAIKLLSLFRA
jgi:rRNA maturation endonuclease Nob1